MYDLDLSGAEQASLHPYLKLVFSFIFRCPLIDASSIRFGEVTPISWSTIWSPTSTARYLRRGKKTPFVSEWAQRLPPGSSPVSGSETSGRRTTPTTSSTTTELQPATSSAPAPTS